MGTWKIKKRKQLLVIRKSLKIMKEGDQQKKKGNLPKMIDIPPTVDPKMMGTKIEVVDQINASQMIQENENHLDPLALAPMKAPTMMKIAVRKLLIQILPMKEENGNKNPKKKKVRKKLRN